ncbi:hypothetical protein ES319_D04G129600v1 [Gossypium barbadense]|uniref:Secreted protein n=1 Tax=Gossypium barbadense TaxID=3634 RepID=A0A5J5RVF9_GOSBA|nr:hypothetical protein ES319_D04G129600v1 [Gossypium barbadense]KAB2035111.1 hypothetical protein ES319_D04G129600v1 [Gossypium barbadense]KAB2035112.1 hypothetical protein ES319_D04G129600v1 [Gossypium barbadense]KAB2035113.1 hypothetical protein ES319_D04G129600v1 [Gossypium barbadense]KAB2035114.1 hypothetical protein ES319_D04G129600v1 [Gossypium barbadense]
MKPEILNFPLLFFFIIATPNVPLRGNWYSSGSVRGSFSSPVPLISEFFEDLVQPPVEFLPSIRSGSSILSPMQPPVRRFVCSTRYFFKDSH